MSEKTDKMLEEIDALTVVELSELVKGIEEKYGVSVLPTDCSNLSIDDINDMFGKLLYEFPIEQMNISLPKWVDSLSDEHWLRKEIFNEIKEAFSNISVLKQINDSLSSIKTTEIIESSSLSEINLGNGNVSINITLKEHLFYQVLTEMTGVSVSDEGDLFSCLTSLAETKKEYDKIAYALEEVKAKGYGIVTPSAEELILDEPEMVKQGSRYGVKLKAKAPSIHMIRADITKKIWESNIFGKSLHELVNEGLQNKLYRMPEDAQMKLQETLERIVNEGSGGLIFIIL